MTERKTLTVRPPAERPQPATADAGAPRREERPKGGKTFSRNRREETPKKPVVQATMVGTVDKGADFVIKKKTVFDRNAGNRPISITYILERPGQKDQDFTQLFAAREAAKTPLPAQPEAASGGEAPAEIQAA